MYLFPWSKAMDIFIMANYINKEIKNPFSTQCENTLLTNKNKARYSESDISTKSKQTFSKT